MAESARAIAEAAVETLRVEAREHKRLSEQHRRRARALNERARRARAALEAAGVEFVLEPDRDPRRSES
jgi:hypothetical protein